MDSNFTIILLITFVFLLVSVFGIGIKILLKKNGEFSGTCASQSPFLNKEGEVCGFCGKKPSEDCENNKPA